MSSIQRPPEAATQLFHRDASQIPLGATLFVEPQDCAVFVQYGAVLGVVPPGTYAIHPQALPMIARAASGPVLQAELWFVRTTLSCTRCGTAHPGGRFCVECGGALAAR